MCIYRWGWCVGRVSFFINVYVFFLSFCFFFFFKQKTAYEIYQCDWSSDVCSSDLVLLQLLGVSRLVQRSQPLNL